MSDVVIPSDCGYIPDPDHVVLRELSECPFDPNICSNNELGAESDEGSVQPLCLPRSQGNGPSCTGQTYAAMVDAVRGPEAPPASAIGPWWDARRRMGNAMRVSGSYLFLVGESIVIRGIETRLPGEDHDIETWTRQPNIDEEMEAGDHRIREFDRSRIAESDPNIIDKINTAIVARPVLGLGWGTDVGSAYQAFHGPGVRGIPEDFALGTDAIGTTGGGHAQRIAGVRRRNGRYQYLIKNSWGLWGLVGWFWHQGEMVRFDTGSIPPGAISLAGCAWVDEDVIRAPRSRDFQLLHRIR